MSFLAKFLCSLDNSGPIKHLIPSLHNHKDPVQLNRDLTYYCSHSRSLVNLYTTKRQLQSILEFQLLVISGCSTFGSSLWLNSGIQWHRGLGSTFCCISAAPLLQRWQEQKVQQSYGEVQMFPATTHENFSWKSSPANWNLWNRDLCSWSLQAHTESTARHVLPLAIGSLPHPYPSFSAQETAVL